MTWNWKASRNFKPFYSMQQQEYITFNLDEEEYAIELGRVKEVVNYKSITRLPNTAPFIKGVINLRGLIIPVVDLRAKFGLQLRPYTKFTIIIVLEVSKKAMGIIIDTVPDVVLLNPRELRPPPSFKTLINKKYISGIGHKDSRLIVVLDIEQIFLEQNVMEALDSSLRVRGTGHNVQKLQSTV